MEATIKETVKNIFKTNKFEDALDLTRNLRGEYIREFGVKSWNGLATYYKSANIIPELPVAAEPEEGYSDFVSDMPDIGKTKADAKSQASALSKKDIEKLFKQKIEEAEESLKDKETGGVPYEEMLEAWIKIQEEFYSTYGVKPGDDYKKALDIYRNFDPNEDQEKFLKQFRESESTDANVHEVSDDANDCKQEENETEDESVDYMLYRNVGDKVEWYGHYVNYAGLKVGDIGMMVRMNNLGVGRGKVLGQLKCQWKKSRSFINATQPSEAVQLLTTRGLKGL